jgi:2-polyprenyl-3-methyl-5-hydroxy-6-metoxy-1,4-benzoquinol methylase
MSIRSWWHKKVHLMNFITQNDLDNFIEKSDRLGGPNSAETAKYWTDLQYKPQHNVDDALDPFSEDYVAEQIKVYEEISGRTLNQFENENTSFNLSAHVEAANPYAASDPSVLLSHYLRLSFLLKQAKLKPAANVLDMGAGWGLSSEYFANLGCTVTAVDINPQFTKLIELRQKKHKLPIKAVCSSFDDFNPSQRFDAVVFYECLHHAVRPWKVLDNARTWLHNDGKLLFAGEPICDYWKHWGLRLDPLSIYCIRKFGWFESGWSLAFMSNCLTKSGFQSTIQYVAVPEIGYICAANKAKLDEYSLGKDLQAMIQVAPDQWHVSDDYLVATGVSECRVQMPDGAIGIELGILNYRPTVIHTEIFATGGVTTEVVLLPGENFVSLKLSAQFSKLTFISETWKPSEEMGTDDTRTMAFHLKSARYLVDREELTRA